MSVEWSKYGSTDVCNGDAVVLIDSVKLRDGGWRVRLQVADKFLPAECDLLTAEARAIADRLYKLADEIDAEKES